MLRTVGGFLGAIALVALGWTSAAPAPPPRPVVEPETTVAQAAPVQPMPLPGVAGEKPAGGGDAQNEPPQGG